jgi:transposase-like protein
LRDTEAAQQCLTQAIRRHGLPKPITIDCNDAKAAIKRYNEEHATAIALLQVKYHNKMVEQDLEQ